MSVNNTHKCRCQLCHPDVEMDMPVVKKDATKSLESELLRHAKKLAKIAASAADLGFVIL